jgi:hypothetical protein
MRDSGLGAIAPSLSVAIEVLRLCMSAVPTNLFAGVARPS